MSPSCRPSVTACWCSTGVWVWPQHQDCTCLRSWTCLLTTQWCSLWPT
jgi:hypothetical protein